MRLFLAALFLLFVPTVSFADSGNVVKEGEVRKVVTDFLAQKTANLPAQTTVKKVGYSGDLQLPAGAVTYEVIAPESWEGWGSASLALIVRVDGQVKKNLIVRVEVEALVDMLVATRTLERGETVTEADLTIAKRDLAKVAGRFCRDVDEAVGKRVKTAIRANTPVRGDYLELVPLVKSGQLVTVLVENEAIKVTTSGRAKLSGGLGELITVQNPTSLKEFPARVINSTTVKVDF
ncbi:flagellar basal body P-ring formation chaperone FlgA [Geomonas sp. RF6]|uniref:flagellar basal body P-ring formation chaperone FlgA n=1 Tax=Geomonas sp. RF6 TaxID=2897342 RepID=UPI001E56678B|nr:flagellar basal body P-ring formation chaperone FlgA [Geomonas sp. RF6]UFS72404.1 flagellar basal body P-ring formation chaperone FlgA [Geomonas sp. RF6]